MAGATHTPGPWEASWSIKRKNGDKEGWFVESNSEEGICSMEEDTLGGIPESIANARLIAAAPVLLEACVVSLAVLQSKNCPWTCSELEKAIAKAKGE